MSIDKIIAILIEGQIKTDISINNIAISHVGENRIKLFIDPEA